MKLTLSALIISLFPTAALASGGVHCQKVQKSLPPVSLSWGAGHVEGSGRISPYRLALSGREIKITEKEAREVGYWIDSEMILVRLADDQVSKTLLLLKAEREGKSDVYKGKLTLNDLSGVTLKDIDVNCTRE